MTDNQEFAIKAVSAVGGVIGSIAIAEFFTGMFSKYLAARTAVKLSKIEHKNNVKAKNAEIERLHKTIREMQK